MESSPAAVPCQIAAYLQAESDGEASLHARGMVWACFFLPSGFGDDIMHAKSCLGHRAQGDAGDGSLVPHFWNGGNSAPGPWSDLGLKVGFW